MTVKNPNDEYSMNLGRWIRLRDALAGEDAVKNKASTYLRRPPGMPIDDFAQYARCSSFFPATARTQAGLMGAVFRREPRIEIPTGQEQLLGNTTAHGVPFIPFAKRVVSEIIGLGRYGVLVDAPATEDGGDPYLSGYQTEAIINWRSTVVDGRPVLTLLVLKESATRVKDEDRFTAEAVTRYRVLELARIVDRNAPVYTVSVFEERKGSGIHVGEDLVLVEGPTIPTRQGQPLDFIPWTFFGPSTLEPHVEQSPLLGLADLNFSHFRTTAEFENSLWFAGTPQFVITGSMMGDGGEQPSTLRVGSNTVWQIEKDGDAKVLQGAAENVSALAQALKDKEARMAVLGARLLEAQQKGNPEHHDTVNLRHRGEDSILASISNTASRGLTRALGHAVWWGGGDPEKVSIELNTDFNAAGMSGQHMVQLVSAWQSGGIGLEVLHHNLKKGEFLPENFDLAAFTKDIEQNGPADTFMGDLSDA